MKRYLDDREIQVLKELGFELKYPNVTIYDLLEFIPPELPDELCHFTITCESINKTWLACYAEEITTRIIRGFVRNELIEAVFELLCWLIRERYVQADKL